MISKSQKKTDRQTLGNDCIKNVDEGKAKDKKIEIVIKLNVIFLSFSWGWNRKNFFFPLPETQIHLWQKKGFCTAKFRSRKQNFKNDTVAFKDFLKRKFAF